MREIIEKVLAEDRDLLTEPEAKSVLNAYRIPTVETRVASDVDGSVALAEELGFPVALKILSNDISHKSDVGGVALDIESAEQLRATATAMLSRVRKLKPDARIDGFTVQNMIRLPGAHELIVGMNDDPIFGPVVLFGQGGTAVEVIADRAIALPPLNMSLAKDVISRTRVSRLLEGYRDRPPADMNAICLTLMKVAQLIADVPEIVELDINPLLANPDGVVALDARISVSRAESDGANRLAIRPYPGEWESEVHLDGRPLTIRPIRPEDEPAHRLLFSKLTQEDIRFRFFGLLRDPKHSELARYTQIDYDREMAFIATRNDEDGVAETLGVARLICDPDNEHGEFAIVVRSDAKGKGLGSVLLGRLIEYGRAHGTACIVGAVLRENKAMLGLAKKMGFQSTLLRDEGVYEVRLPLRPA